MEDFHCSFCGKRRLEVRKLISGRRVFICDECVARCRQILGPRLIIEDATTDPERTTEDLPAQPMLEDEEITGERAGQLAAAAAHLTRAQRRFAEPRRPVRRQRAVRGSRHRILVDAKGGREVAGDEIDGARLARPRGGDADGGRQP